MEKTTVIEYLKSNDFEDVEEIKYKDESLIVRFYYDFDDSEIEAASAYANDECEEESEGEIWYNKFFIPYLNDIVVDNVGEIIENCSEEFDLEAQFITYDIDEEQIEYAEIIAEFANRGQEIDVEKAVDDLKI
ncbi:hypothetical protein SAMN02745134_01004 [Clostridium acidisoli DSM 12555]|uniref:Uncharacterized protein n=1 Tax=Clostridium acidisoli DSM 12555 TaxID=1121291 RepID=A0A1W1X951_9CLOT|nr:hypothetical protein [Clostridium acidisoli]SMC20041.1 hypothetical protein SAMN02745134_01004 [Clostridium acidisoli DSM 12555]